MDFVGREKEIRQIQRALERGKNIILTGKYGMGRTCLLKKVAQVAGDRWRFVFADLSRTPGKVCADLAAELLPDGKGQGRDGNGGYKSDRFRITHLDLKEPKPHVLVLDRIGKLSAPKLDLVRRLAAEGRFRLVAIVEAFVGEKDLLNLRASLMPSILIHLSYLSRKSAREFFRRFSRQHHFQWTEEEIQSLAETSGGYPLGMKEIAARKLARSRSIKDEAILAKAKRAGAKATSAGEALPNSVVSEFPFLSPFPNPLPRGEGENLEFPQFPPGKAGGRRTRRVFRQ